MYPPEPDCNARSIEFEPPCHGFEVDGGLGRQHAFAGQEAGFERLDSISHRGPAAACLAGRGLQEAFHVGEPILQRTDVDAGAAFASAPLQRGVDGLQAILQQVEGTAEVGESLLDTCLNGCDALDDAAVIAQIVVAAGGADRLDDMGELAQPLLQARFDRGHAVAERRAIANIVVAALADIALDVLKRQRHRLALGGQLRGELAQGLLERLDARVLDAVGGGAEISLCGNGARGLGQRGVGDAVAGALTVVADQRRRLGAQGLIVGLADAARHVAAQQDDAGVVRADVDQREQQVIYGRGCVLASLRQVGGVAQDDFQIFRFARRLLGRHLRRAGDQVQGVVAQGNDAGTAILECGDGPLDARQRVDEMLQSDLAGTVRGGDFVGIVAAVEHDLVDHDRSRGVRIIGSPQAVEIRTGGGRLARCATARRRCSEVEILTAVGHVPLLLVFTSRGSPRTAIHPVFGLAADAGLPRTVRASCEPAPSRLPTARDFLAEQNGNLLTVAHYPLPRDGARCRHTGHGGYGQHARCGLSRWDLARDEMTWQRFDGPSGVVM